MLPFLFPMPAEKKTSFINVDELMPKVTVEQAAAYYGVPLPELKRIGSEVRSACFLNCGKAEQTGDRVLAMQVDHPARPWHCHKYGCNRGSNLIGLCDLMKPGGNGEGKPRGQRFREIAQDLQVMAASPTPPRSVPPPISPATVSTQSETPHNVPLSRSDNERARTLVDLDQKFITDPAKMIPAASSYFRRRPYLTPEVCKAFRMGFLPRDTGSDSSGGSLRGQIIYPYMNDANELLCWFGRDPNYEEKLKVWQAGTKENEPPHKFRFVKGFHRGQQIWNEEKLKDPSSKESLMKYGTVLVEGPNDAIRLNTLGVTAVALCSNAITREQASKLARHSREHGNGIVTIFLDNDPEGERGMKQALGYLAQVAPVRMAWTPQMHEGRFQNRQPESLTEDEWKFLAEFLEHQSPVG